MSYSLPAIIFILVNIFILLKFNFLSKYFNLFDFPNQNRKKQIKPISLFGGFIFVINFILFLSFDIYSESNLLINYFGINSNIKIFLFIVLFFSIYLIGYADDKFDLKPFTKIVLVTICLYLTTKISPNILINSIRSDFLSKEIDLFFLGPIFTIFCLLCFLNAMNMFDGINLIAFLQFLLVALVLLINNQILIFSSIIIFSLLIFGYLNIKNLSYFGDSGIYVLSFIVGLLLIAFYRGNNLNVEEVVILIYLPILDFIRLFFARIYRGKSPFLPDEKHLHHFLLKKFNFKKTILILFVLLYLPSVLNYMIGYTNMILIFFTIIYFVLLNMLKK